jgi:hypothetical protein
MRRSLRPEAPSTAGGHSRTCVNRAHLVREYVFSRRPSPRRPFTLGSSSHAFARSRLPRARSPSPPTAASRCSRETSTCASLDQAAALRLLQLTSDARSHPRASDSRVSMRHAVCRVFYWHRICCSLSRCFLRHCVLPLSKKVHESCEPRQALRSQLDGAASTPQNRTSKTILRSRRRLRATPRSDHRLRRWPLEHGAGLRRPSSR